MKIKQILTSCAAVFALASSTAEAEKLKGYVSIGGDYVRELSHRSHYDTYIGDVHDALNIKDPLSSDGLGANVRGGILLGNGYGLELEIEGRINSSEKHGNIRLLNEILKTKMRLAEYRGEIWANAFREFHPFADQSTLYFGTGAGLLMDKTDIDFGYDGTYFAEVGESYAYDASGIGFGARLFAGSSFQVYKHLFVNVRSGLKLGKMKVKIEKISSDEEILPDRARKTILEMDVNANLEWKF